MRAEIRTDGDLLAFRRDVRHRLAQGHTAGPPLEEVLLALTEMGTNLVRHGGGGILEVTEDREGGTVRLEARNGVSDPPAVGVARPGLSIGVESLGRLMDRVWFTQDPGFGIACEKRLHPRRGGRP